MLRSQRSRKSISFVVINGTFNSNAKVIKHHVLNIYQNLFNTNGNGVDFFVVPYVIDIIPSLVSTQNNSNILASSYGDEI